MMMHGPANVKFHYLVHNSTSLVRTQSKASHSTSSGTVAMLSFHLHHR